MFKVGMIHGRFQPFCLGHFEYLKSALECSEKLIVGITNPDPSQTDENESDSHRHKPDANPFPYFLRVKMIQKAVLIDQKISHRYNDITIVPFPINKPRLWEHYIPLKAAVQIMNILDPWDNVKQKMFIETGYQVHILGHGRYRLIDGTPISGTFIRHAILSETDWRDKVPNGTNIVLENWLSNNIEAIF